MKQALVIIDMQEVFFTEVENYIYHRKQLVENVNTLIDWARTSEIPVIFVQHTDINPSDEMAKGKLAWELHEGLHRKNNDPIIEKTTWDAFYQTSLEESLTKLEIEQIIFAGAQTEFCLDTTIRAAYSKGYQNNLLVEGTHSTLDSGQLNAEQIMKHHESIWNNRFVQIQPISLYKS